MILRLAILAGIGLFGAIAASAHELPSVPRRPSTHPPYSAVGLASWYGSDFQGHATADGEVFDMRSLSAAHRTMPLPSYARVTNLSNGRSVIVRVNDRGPFVRGRIVDVSARVAKLLQFNSVGLTKVRLEYAGKAPPAGSDGPALLASLQTGASPSAEPALSAAPLAPGGAKPAPSAARLAAVDAAPPVQRPAPVEGVTVVTRAVERPKATPSPYGDLVTYPFLARASAPGSPDADRSVSVAYPSLAQASP